MNYFKNRNQAGQELAAQLKELNATNASILCLSDGGVEVAIPIAETFGLSVQQLLSEPVYLPGQGEQLFGVVDQSGNFTENDLIPEGFRSELRAEFHTYMDQERVSAMSKLSMGDVDEPKKELLKGKKVILVSDGLSTGYSVQAAIAFLKPIEIARIIVAVPIASVEAIDKMHILCDEIHCLNVTPRFISNGHYYESPEVTDRDTLLKVIENK